MHLYSLNKKKLNKLFCTVLTGVCKLKTSVHISVKITITDINDTSWYWDDSNATPLTYDITTLQMWKYLVGKLTLLLRIQYKPNHFGKLSRVVTILMLHTELRTCITIFGDSHLLGCDASLVTWFLTFQRVLPSFSGVKKSKKNGSSETP
jgi:hypothetical protein